MSEPISAIVTEIATLVAEPWIEPLSATTLEEQRRIYFANRDRQTRLVELREQAIKLFAASRGWRWSRSQFGVETLAAGGVRDRVPQALRPIDWPLDLTDHRIGFRHHDRRAAGLTGQPYATEADLRPKAEAWAEQHGLAVTFPAFPSWWFPGRTIPVLFERRSADIHPMGQAS